MPKPKTTKTLTFEVSVKVPVEAKTRDVASSIREAVGDLRDVSTPRVKLTGEG